MTWQSVKNLYLTFAISFLALLTAIFTSAPENYRIALFTTMSMPVMYAAKYYHSGGKYFRNIEREILTDIQVYLASYFAGYVMYVSTTADASLQGMILFAIAYTVVILMRYALQLCYSFTKPFTNPDSPLIIILLSFIISCTFFFVEMVFLRWYSCITI